MRTSLAPGYLSPLQPTLSLIEVDDIKGDRVSIKFREHNIEASLLGVKNTSTS